MDLLKRLINSSLLNKVFQLIGPFLFIFIFVKFVDISLLFQTLKSASKFYLFLSYILTLLILILRILRIFLPIKKNMKTVSFCNFVKIFISTRLLGWVSNVFISDFANAVIIMKSQENKIRISNIFIMNRVVDVISTLIIFGVSFYLNFYLIDTYIHVSNKKLFLFLFIFITLIALILLLRKKIANYLADLGSTAKTFIPDTALISISIVLCVIFSVIFDAKALNISITTSYLLLCYTAGIAITVLPISISGIGTREITHIFLLEIINIRPEKAVALSLVQFIFIPLLSLLTLYIIAQIGVCYENSNNS